ncbi:MAG: hypothetical protein U0R51_10270 [Solirubrobacterales bacterium]
MIVLAAPLAAPASSTVGASSKPLCHGQRATFVGGPGRDRLTYQWSQETDLGRYPVIVLRGGDDVVDFGLKGRRVTICAGPGDDKIELFDGGFSRYALVDGGPGEDAISPAGSTDEVQLPPMTMLGGPGDDVLGGSNGDDRIIGSGGADALYGYWGDDRIDGGAGRDRADGGGDRDHCWSAESVENCERLVP